MFRVFPQDHFKNFEGIGSQRAFGNSFSAEIGEQLIGWGRFGVPMAPFWIHFSLNMRLAFRVLTSIW